VFLFVDSPILVQIVKDRFRMDIDGEFSRRAKGNDRKISIR